MEEVGSPRNKGQDIKRSIKQEEKILKAVTFDEIPGLRYYNNVITKEQEEKIVKEINKQEWNSQLKRRTQHYGYRYDYQVKSIDESMYLGQLPHYAQEICQRLYDDNIIHFIPDQMIVNEYLPGQGISPHIDRPDVFGDTVFTISLASKCLMNFSLPNYSQDVLLQRRSVAILQGDSRFKFKHAIASRKTDKYQGNLIQRKTRISLTFRQAQFLNKDAKNL